MPCEVVAKQVGDLGLLLWELSSMKRTNAIAEQNKQKFYDMLLTQRENFDSFYKDQVPYFKADANSLLSDLSDAEIAEIYNSLPAGQFTKGKTEYYNFVQSKIDEYILSQWKKKMQTDVAVLFHQVLAVLRLFALNMVKVRRRAIAKFLHISFLCQSATWQQVRLQSCTALRACAHLL